MRTLKAIAGMLSVAFLMSCGVEPAKSDPNTGVVESQVLVSCESRQGDSCPFKGYHFACDNGTDEPGVCDCVLERDPQNPRDPRLFLNCE